MPDTSPYSDDDVFESLSHREWEPDPEDEGFARERFQEAIAGPTYPGANTSLAMRTGGFYQARWPAGAIVHFTAGHCDRGDPDAAATVKYGAGKGHCYFCMSRTGLVYQTADLKQWGSHAGKSSYAGLGTSVSSKIVGIEVCNAGRLTKTARGYEPEWNKPGAANPTIFSEDRVRLVEPDANILSRGYFLKYSTEQEESLIELLLWMHRQNPAVFKLDFVLGHDEVSPRRKDDPGGSLSMTMPKFRDLLRQKAETTIVAVSQAAVAAGATASDTKLEAAAAAIKYGPDFHELLRVYRETPIEHPHLKDITFAQWAHETGYGTSQLAILHRNFAGMKWRPDMARFAEKVYYKPEHDPMDTSYCGFSTLANFVRGYWHRLDITSLPYATTKGGWRAHAGNAGEFIDFIGPIWAPEGGDNSPLNNGYVRKVKSVLEKLRAANMLPSSKPVVAMASGEDSNFESIASAIGPSTKAVLRKFYDTVRSRQPPLDDKEIEPYIAEFLAQPIGDDIVSRVEIIRLAAGLLPPDMLKIGQTAEPLHAAIAQLRQPLQPKVAEVLIEALRDARAFDWLARITDCMLSIGHTEPKVRRFNAQALVETGHLNAAISVLEQLKRTDLPNDELAEVLGQLGRAHKQIYVNLVKSPADAYASNHVYAGFLREAIRSYGAAFDPRRLSDTSWHGINLVALVRRAAADGVPLGGGYNADEIAESIIGELEPALAKAGDPWISATLGEACIALGKYDDAVRHFSRYANDNKNIKVFHLSATIRQLEEVWRADGAGEGARRCLMTLKAAAAGKTYAAFGITAQERKVIRSEKFETAYPDSDFIQHSLLRKIVRAGESVAWVKDRHLNGVGTGFLIVGSDLAKSLGNTLYLLTNTHVICDPALANGQRPNGSLTPSEARIFFEASGEDVPREYRLVANAEWQSPSSEFDACLLRLTEDPPVKPARFAAPEHVITYGDEADDTDGTPVAVLGHAGGRELQIGLRGTLRNHQGCIVDIGTRDRNGKRPVYLHYDAPTLGGNSGSPVYDTTTWQVIGLHHAGYDNQDGRAQLRGRGGYNFANEGICVRSIGAAIEADRTAGKSKGVLAMFKTGGKDKT